jgi:hypothetical protein
MITAADSLTGEDLINIEDVTARIAHLEAHDCHRTDFADWCSDYECATCDDGSGQELTALRELLAEMEPVNDASGRASAIRDSYMEKFVRDEIEDVTEGLEYVSGFIKWDELTADRQGEMTETTFLGTTYYITS